MTGQTDKQCLIESGRRISQSSVWAAQKDYYVQHGIDLWKSRPAFVAARTHVIESLAASVMSYIIDCSSHLRLDKPLYLIELGAGSGCFAYRFTQALQRRLSADSTLSQLKFRYLMTDIISDLLPIWRNNAQLSELADRGIIGFSRFDPAIDESIYDGRHQLTSFDNPPMFIANSVFDTIAIDGFKLDGGTLREIVADLYVPQEMTLVDAVRSNTLELCQRLGDPVDLPYFRDNVLDNILADYVCDLNSGYISVPIGAIEIIRKLEMLASSGFALLTCSRGFSGSAFMQNKLVMRYHDLSFPLNFDFIRRYFERRGGVQFQYQSNEISHLAALTVLGGARPQSFYHSSSLFGDADRQERIHVLLDQQASLQTATIECKQIGYVHALLKMLQDSSDDPQLFYLFVTEHFDELEREVADLSDSDSASMSNALRRVDANIFSLGKEIGVLTPETEELLALLIKVWKRAQSTAAGRI